MSERKQAAGLLKVGTDLFGAAHVYNVSGERITNDRMCRTEGWEEMAASIVASVNFTAGFSTEALEEMDLAELVSRAHDVALNGKGAAELMELLSKLGDGQ